MKILRSHILVAILYACYVIATIFESNLWGNLLSPIATFISMYIVAQYYYIREKSNVLKVAGLFLSLGIFSYGLADTIWGILDLIFHIAPEQIKLISFTYSLTNICFTIFLIIYGIYQVRKWNGAQFLLDCFTISMCVYILVWVIFLNSNVGNLLLLQSDWISTASILLDILAFILITTWCVSMRKGVFPLFLVYLYLGFVGYVITDLIYFYQYFYKSYDPNTILDACYVASFIFISLSGRLQVKYMENCGERNIVFNVGDKGKGIYLFVAPILLIAYKGLLLTHLLNLLVLILAYYMFSYYIQRNIYKEETLQKEKELNNNLEQMVKARTEELLQKNKDLDYLLNQDLITGLHNRRYFVAHLDKMLEGLPVGEHLILLYIDLNKLKMIQLMFGNYIGDKVLIEISKRLVEFQKSMNSSILAAYGEQTFTLLLQGSYHYADAVAISQDVIDICSDIYKIDEYEVRMTVNVGVSIYPLDAKSAEELMKHGDIAMSQARLMGFNNMIAYDKILGDVIFRRNKIEMLLKKVVFDRDFFLVFQPQFNTHDQSIIGFEALLRWKTPEGEYIPPSEFIPLAEETGYIICIGDWVMKKALEQLAAWNYKAAKKYTMGINVSMKQLNGSKFLDRLKYLMNEYRIKPQWIDLEITESIQCEDNKEMRDLLQEIKDMGISISIDDFGTGYSSLSYLKNLQVNRIKIAKALIDRIDTDDYDYQIVKSVITISKVKKIKVIAEGVETKEQWSCLKAMQCDEIQGYFFEKPLLPYEIESKYFSLHNEYPIDKAI